MVFKKALFFLFFAGFVFVIIACQALGGQAGKPIVIIASPPSGSVYTVGEEVVVQSTATDPTGVVSVALLVDGQVVREDPSPVAQGQAQFSLIQSWIATNPGQHTLTVRATNTQGATADSAILITVREEGGQKPTSVISIATAVPLGTAAPATAAPPSIAPTGAPAQTTNGTPASTCVLSSKFVADLTIPDGTTFTPNAVFTKSWRVQNNGTCVWQNYELAFIEGTQMAASGLYPVPDTPPGATADLTVPMTAPATYGAYSGTWKIRNAAGQIFGTPLTVVINVPAPAATIAPSNTPPPTVAACSGKPNEFTFSASATTITAGQSVTLSWGAVTNASEVYLNGGEFSDEGVAAPGKRTVSPNETTEYRLQALCSKGGTAREKSVIVTVTAPAGNFSGNWVHNFGTMSITQNGNTVSGTYQNSFDGESGVLAGIVSGNVLTGTFTKNETLPIEFTLSNDGKRFTGNWNGSNSWCGARPGANFPNGCSYAGKFVTDNGDNSNCEMSLVRKDDHVTGTFCDGTLEGDITYNADRTILMGQSLSNGNSQSLTYYLFGYNALQFNGNWGSTNQWCGWRESMSAPEPCLYP